MHHEILRDCGLMFPPDRDRGLPGLHHRVRAVLKARARPLPKAGEIDRGNT